MAVCCLMLTGCSGNKLADCFSREELETQTQENIRLAESGDYEAFMETVEPLTRSAFTEEVYDQYLEAVGAKGAFQKFGKTAFVGQTDKDTGANYAAVIILAEYENGKLQYTVGYNEQMQIVQFLIK